MAEKTKNQLHIDINRDIVENTENTITGTQVNTIFNDIVDSMVITGTTDLQSVLDNGSIASILTDDISDKKIDITYTDTDSFTNQYNQMTFQPNLFRVYPVDDEYSTEFKVEQGRISLEDANALGENMSLSMSMWLGSTTFTDGRITPKGIEYADDYSTTFVDRSLVDKGYVDAQVSGLAPTLQQVLDNGGSATLTSGDYSSQIDLISSYKTLYSRYDDGTNITYNQVYVGADDGLSIESHYDNSQGDDTSNNTTHLTMGNGAYTQIYCGDKDGSVSFEIASSSNGSIFDDNRTTPTGLEYGGDYENTLSGRSLVTKNYVDSKRPYKVYTAILSSDGYSAPTATTILEDTTLGVLWSYSYPNMIATISGTTINTKFFVIAPLNNNGNINVFGKELVIDYQSSTSQISFYIEDQGGDPTYGFDNQPIEIRVYN